MTVLLFLIQWAIRSFILILCGAGIVWALRVKNVRVRLSVWIALLIASFAIPVLTLTLPVLPISILRAEPAMGPQAVPGMVQSLPDMPLPVLAPVSDRPFDWAQIALLVYAAGVLLLLLRILVGLVLTRRLLRDTRATHRDLCVSDKVTAPLVLGILRPVLVLPCDWREWDRTKLDAVLAHERSHIRRYDPAVQLLSAIHRAVLWINPANWLLHVLIVHTAEEASDAAAVGEIGDRAFYAEVLLGFMQRGIRRANWLGVPMAHFGAADRRIQRILAGTIFSSAVSRRALAAMTIMVSALACLIAIGHLSQAASPIPGGRVSLAMAPASPGKGAQPLYMSAIGTVTATTVGVVARIDGQLTSAGCADGRPVRTGQLLATIESSKAGNGPAYTQIRAPISGLTGFCKVDPGNFVHGGETLLTITQIHPIAVVFSIPQEYVPRFRALLGAGVGPMVEAFNRENMRLAAGRVTAMNNAIDPATGMASLRASFENTDGALFPNAFVILRLPVSTRKSDHH